MAVSLLIGNAPLSVEAAETGNDLNAAQVVCAGDADTELADSNDEVSAGDVDYTETNIAETDVSDADISGTDTDADNGEVTVSNGGADISTVSDGDVSGGDAQENNKEKIEVIDTPEIVLYKEIVQNYGYYDELGDIRFRVTDSNGNITEMSFGDETYNGFALWYETVNESGEYVDLYSAEAGQYYLKFSSYNLDASVKVPVAFKPVTEMEQELAFGEKVVFPGYKAYWYCYDIETTGLFQIDYFSDNSCWVEVYDSNWNRIIQTYPWEHHVLYIDKADKYYVRLYGYSSSNSEFSFNEVEASDTFDVGVSKDIAAESDEQMVWYRFVPEEEGAYKISTSENSNLNLYLYDSTGNKLSERSGSYVSMQNDLEAGKEYYYAFCLRSQRSATVIIEKVPRVTSAEILSYYGNPEVCYELLPRYYAGFNPGNVSIRIYLDDGSYVDAEQWDTTWYNYNISYSYKDKEGNIASIDDNGHYSVGDYYIEYTIQEKQFDLKIPFTMYSVEDIKDVLTVDQAVIGLEGSDEYWRYESGIIVKMEIDEPGYFCLESSDYARIELYGPDYQSIETTYGQRYYFNAEKGTYYVKIRAQKDFDITLNQMEVKELTLGQAEDVTIANAGEAMLFSFTPETTRYYDMTSLGNYATYAALKTKDGSVITTDSYSGEGNNFYIYEKLNAGETYVLEVIFGYSNQTGSFQIHLSEAPAIADIQVEYGPCNTGKVYYGLNLQKYRSLSDGLIYRVVYDDGSTAEYDYAYYKYFNVSITNKETGEYAGYDSNGYYPIGTYEVAVTCAKESTLSDSIEIQVLSHEDLDVVLSTEQAAENLSGTTSTGKIVYSALKVEIEQAGRYYFTSTASYCYASLYDADLNLVCSSNQQLSNIVFEAEENSTYYLVVYIYSPKTYEVELFRMKVPTLLETTMAKEPVLYNALGNNNVSSIMNSRQQLKMTFDDKESMTFTVYSSDWNRYGLSYAVYQQNSDSALSSSTMRNLPVGNYEIRITSSIFDVECVIPFSVKAPQNAETVQLGMPIKSDTTTMIYKLEIEEEGAYTVEYEEESNNSYIQMCLAASISGSVYSYSTVTLTGNGGTRYVHLKQGTNYIFIRNNIAPEELEFTITKLPDIVQFDYEETENYTFNYGDWGYYVGESVSGGKYTTANTVSGSTNKKPLVSNSPVDYYVSGNRVSQYNFDLDMELELEDGSVLETFCNSLLWKAYGIIQKILNLDGSPVYTDQNGYVEIGEYKVEFSAGDASIEIPFAVTESDTVKDIRKATVSIEEQTYSGEAIMPIPVVMYGEKALVKDTDYVISYENNIEAGTAAAIIKGIKGYSGTLKVQFEIKNVALTSPVLLENTNTAGGIMVKWEKVTGATGYIVYRKTDDTKWSRLKVLSDGDTVSYVDGFVESGTKYTYTVIATRESEKSSYDKSGKSILYLAQPAISTLIEETEGIHIGWDTIAGASEYIVYRKVVGGKWIVVATVEGEANNSYIDTTAAKATTYLYTVRAANGTAKSSYDAGSSITTEGIDTPELLSATNTSSGVKVSWNAVEDADGYIVYRKTSAGKWQRLKTLTGGTASSYTDVAAVSGNLYTYTVRATFDSILSGYDKTGVSVFYLEEPEPSIAKNTAAGITIGWNEVEGAESYTIYRKITDGKWTVIGTQAADDGASFVDETAVGGTEYLYTVRAASSNYKSSFHAGISVTAVSLSIPELEACTNQEDGVLVKWNEVEDADGYIVYRRTGSDKWVRMQGVSGGSSVSWLDITAESGTKYTYTVMATLKNKRSSYDKTGTSIFYLAQPAVEATIYDGQGVKVSWSKADGATGYIVYRKVPGGKWTTLSTVKGTDTVEYTDTAVESGITYVYTVRAYYGTARSAFDKAGVTITVK